MLSAENQGLARRETKVPGIATILDIDRLSDLMQSMDPSGMGEGIALQYVRYKPGRRCVALFEYYDRTGSVKPFVATAYDADGWKKYVATGRAESAKTQGAILLPSCQMALEWFPNDHALKPIAKLHDQARQTKVLYGLFGDRVSLEEVALETLAYKPGRRYVAKLGLQDEHYVLKFYTSTTFEPAQSLTCKLVESRLMSGAPVGLCPKNRVVATPWIEGHTLSSLMLQEGFSEDLVLATARELANWQKQAMTLIDLGMRRQEGHTLTSLTSLTEDLLWLQPNIQPMLSSLMRRLVRLHVELPIANDVLHGDFYAKQVIADGNTIHFIDFDEVSMGDRYQDVGNFIAQVYWNALRGDISYDAAERLSSLFLSEYVAQWNSYDQSRLAFHVIAAFLRCVPHSFRRGLENWPAKMEQMLEWASKWMDDFAFPPISPSNVECDFQTPKALAAAFCRSDTKLSEKLQGMQIQRSAIVRYKPQRRVMLEYAFYDPLGVKETIHVLGKARIKKGVDLRTPALHEQLRLLGFAGDSSMVVPEVLGVIPCWNMWLQKKEKGSRVSCTSETPLRWHFDIGRAIGEFHQAPIQLANRHTIEDELRILDEWLFERSLDFEISWKSDIVKIRERCYQLASTLHESSPVLVHRDFYFDQALVDGSRVILVDLDLAAMGPPEVDLGNYLAHLDEYAVRNPRSEEYCQNAAISFLEGYSSSQARCDQEAVLIWRELSLARHIGISRKHRERRSTTRRLIDRLLELQDLQEIGLPRSTTLP